MFIIINIIKKRDGLYPEYRFSTPKQMLFLKGTRKAGIKTYQYHSHQCENCKEFDLTIKVYKDYFHVYFIPFAATGVKSSVIHCNSCGSRVLSGSLSKEYESKTKIPFYLYCGLILVALFVLSMFAVSAWGQHERSTYISNPKVGDVYLIKKEAKGQDEYNFVRVKRIDGDSVIAYDGHLIYLSFTSSFSPEDYFDTGEEVGYTKFQLKQLFEKGTIETIYRDYDEATGFNRIK